MSDYSQWSDDDLEDEEFPEDDPLDDDEPELIPCAHCGQEMYEDSVQCPHCGSYVTADTSVWSGRSWWWIVVGALGVAAVVWGSIAVYGG